MKPWRDRTRAERTVKNPRWWLVLPVSLLMLLFIFPLHLTGKVLYSIGHVMCVVSNRIHYMKMPKPIERLYKWMHYEA